jgi:hypothetical protein
MVENKEENEDIIVEKITDLPGGSVHKFVYLVRTEEGYFITSEVHKGGACIEFIGYEIEPLDTIEIKNYDDAIKKINKRDTQLSSMTYPWNRVISIKHVTYKRRNK